LRAVAWGETVTYGELAKRPPFIEHCGGIPLT